MSPLARAAFVAVGIALAVLLFVVLRPGDEGESSAPTTTTATTAPSTTPTPTTTTTTPAKPKPPARTTIAITIRGGKPVGGIKHVTLRRNQKAVLVVRSDVADEVHLHGYDLKRDVAAGGIARIPFTASIPGRFEAELEQRRLPILDLEVR
jgi:hypothetical protein